MSPENLELLGNLRIPNFLSVEINDADTDAMFDFAFAKLVQIRTPPRKLLQVVGDMLGQENVIGVAAIHHALRDIDASPGNVGLLV